MRTILLFWGFTAVVCAQHAAPPTGPTAEAAWRQLQAGSQRYASGRLTHQNQTEARRTEVAKGQHPFVAVLSCADSRVPPEIVFDQGLGDIFPVRVAGNVASDEVIASLEYAVAHLGPKLIVVLGHERCGAVDAALKGGPPEGHLAVILDRIKPAVVASQGKPGDPLNNAIQENIRNMVKQLAKTGPILSEKIKSGEIKIMGAEYDLDSGKIELVR